MLMISALSLSRSGRPPKNLTPGVPASGIFEIIEEPLHLGPVQFLLYARLPGISFWNLLSINRLLSPLKHWIQPMYT
jgi:hypothetical protein